jgi:signal transduction histidine kinase
LADLLQRETFFEQLPRIDQHTHAIQSAYTACFDAAAGARRQAYSEALDSLRATPGWEQLDDDQKQRIAQPLSDRVTHDVPRSTAIPQVRAETDACPKLLHDAIEQVRRAVEGVRMAQVDAGSYFKDGIETEEQLDAALGGLREECAKYVGEGKKVFLK